ncbi:hypothetical protein AB0B31_21945 [Catellatospora citrea]|uniref:hypothetical protein n=1 Tax=Catellatospora citrea TaxID=53366 RepID=UPI0034063453
MPRFPAICADLAVTGQQDLFLWTLNALIGAPSVHENRSAPERSPMVVRVGGAVGGFCFAAMNLGLAMVCLAVACPVLACPVVTWLAVADLCLDRMTPGVGPALLLGPGVAARGRRRRGLHR